MSLQAQKLPARGNNDQKQGESLQNYSLSLIKLLNKILYKNEKAVFNFDEILKD